jgi:protein TonB
MFGTLLESRRPSPPARRRRLVGAASVAAHVAVAALAVVATADATRAPAPPSAVDLVHYQPVPEPRPAAPPTGRPGPADGGAASTPAPRAPALPDALPIDVPTVPPVGIPEPQAAAPAGSLVGAEEFAGRGLARGGGDAGAPGDGPGPAADDAPLDAARVERAVVPRRGNPAPRYPEALRRDGVEGRAVLRFVVDTAGRIEPGSLVVLGADHPLFAQAALAAAPRLRFAPATVAGRPVRQLVEQAFEFALQR